MKKVILMIGMIAVLGSFIQPAVALEESEYNFVRMPWIMRAALDFRADKNKFVHEVKNDSELGNGIFYFAVTTGDMAMFEEMLKLGFSINAKPVKLGDTFDCVGDYSGNIESHKCQLYNVGVTSELGVVAAGNGRIKIIRKMWKVGYTIRNKNNLLIAAIAGQEHDHGASMLPLIKYLVEDLHADVNLHTLPGNDYTTPLFLAIRNIEAQDRRYRTVKYLVDHGAKTSCVNSEKRFSIGNKSIQMSDGPICESAAEMLKSEVGRNYAFDHQLIFYNKLRELLQ